MEKHIKWRDRSFLTKSQPECWVPEAIIEFVEGATSIFHPIVLPDAEHNAIKKGELRYSTREQAKAAAKKWLRELHGRIGVFLKKEFKSTDI